MPKFSIVNFSKYHPAAREITPKDRSGNGKLKWVRLDTDWDHDEDIALLPWAEQAIWPWLLARSGKGNPVGTFDLSVTDVARLTTLSEDQASHVLKHLRKRGRIQLCVTGA